MLHSIAKCTRTRDCKQKGTNQLDNNYSRDSVALYPHVTNTSTPKAGQMQARRIIPVRVGSCDFVDRLFFCTSGTIHEVTRTKTRNSLPPQSTFEAKLNDTQVVRRTASSVSVIECPLSSLKFSAEPVPIEKNKSSRCLNRSLSTLPLHY